MENNIDTNNIKGKFRAKSGKTYIFLKDGSLIEEDLNGNITKIDLSIKENIKRIKEDIGEGHTDVVRWLMKKTSGKMSR